MMKRPFFLRGYTTEFAPTEGHTLPAVASPMLYAVPLQQNEGGAFLDTHRVIRLERDYWVSDGELADLASEDALGRQVATAALFWVGMTLLGAVFAALAWLGWLPT